MNGQKIVDIARSQVGVKESPPESNKVKYNDWIYGKPVQGPQYPWCAAFYSWAFNEAGIPLPKIDTAKGFVGCNFAVKNVSLWGNLVDEAMPGDACFFDWNGDGHFDHVGIFVRKIDQNQFETIEGNTSPANDSNGGEVMIRHRKYKNVVFIRPNVLK